jgi:hypothetical protein
LRFVFVKVHDEEQRWLIHGEDKVSVFEETFVLMQIGVLSHRVGNCLVERQAELKVLKVN